MVKSGLGAAEVEAVTDEMAAAALWAQIENENSKFNKKLALKVAKNVGGKLLKVAIKSAIPIPIPLA